MTREEIEAAAVADYREHLGAVLEVTQLECFRNDRDEHVGVDLEHPACVRVVETPRADLLRWVDDEFCDPAWNVDLIVPHPELDGLRLSWMYGHSYRVGEGQSRSTAFRVLYRPPSTGTPFERRFRLCVSEQHRRGGVIEIAAPDENTAVATANEIADDPRRRETEIRWDSEMDYIKGTFEITDVECQEETT